MTKLTRRTLNKHNQADSQDFKLHDLADSQDIKQHDVADSQDINQHDLADSQFKLCLVCKRPCGNEFLRRLHPSHVPVAGCCATHNHTPWLQAGTGEDNIHRQNWDECVAAVIAPKKKKSNTSPGFFSVS